MTKKRIKTEKFLNSRVPGAAALNVTGMTCTQTQFHLAATAALQWAHSWLWPQISAAANSNQSCNFGKQCIKCKNLPCAGSQNCVSSPITRPTQGQDPRGSSSSWETCAVFRLCLQWLQWGKLLPLLQPHLPGHYNLHYKQRKQETFPCLGTGLDSFMIWIPAALPLVPSQPHYSVALKTVSSHENPSCFLDLLDVQAE